MENERKCCWGILGAAEIARKNWQAILHSGNGHLKAVASRSEERAATLIADCEALAPFSKPVQAVQGYDKLLADPEIDAVYIPLPTVVRNDWALAAIEAGKHVLIEKPCSPSADQLAKIIVSAEAKNLQVMDGVMFAHSRRFDGLMDAIHNEKIIGDVRRITSQFSFLGVDPEWKSANIRCDSRMEPFGALGDLGWYCIRMSLATMGNVLPEKVVGRALQTYQHQDASKPVPTEFEGTLFFANNVTASLYCSFVTELQQWANISGTDGFIAIEDFVLPYRDRQPQYEIVKSEFVCQSCDFNMHRKHQAVSFDESPNSAADSQEASMFRDFNDCVIHSKTDYRWPQASLNTQIVMDALMRSAKEAQSEIIVAANYGAN